MGKAEAIAGAVGGIVEGFKERARIKAKPKAKLPELKQIKNKPLSQTGNFKGAYGGN